MNQILSVEMSKGKKTSKKIGINPIIIFFCIILLIFGCSMVAVGVSSMQKNNSTNISNENNTGNKPKIEIVQGTSALNVAVSSEDGIDKIIYKWNNEEQTQINGNNDTSMSMEIKIPVGINILTISVTDKNGGNKTFQKEYVGVEEYTPNVVLAQENNTLKVSCTSESIIKNISYHFDQEEEKIEEINDKNGEISVKVIEGKHTLNVKVVDINNRKYEDEKDIYIPIVSAKASEDRKKFIIKAEDARGISKIKITVNGETIEREGNGTAYTEEFELKNGEDRIIVSVTNVDNLSIIKGFK